MKIYLVDTIGNETGMHLYDEAVRECFADQDSELQIVSNFALKDGTAPALRNFYKGGKAKKVYNLLRSLLSFKRLLRKVRQEDVVIYQSFGLRNIDRIFIKLISAVTNPVVIVHDIFDIRKKGDEDPEKALKTDFYRNNIKHVICHSERTERDLRELGYTGSSITIPHFSYRFDKSYRPESIASDVKEAVAAEKKNFLFFGQLRDSKGIDVLLDAITHLKSGNVNLIIAGTDKDGFLAGKELPDFVSVVGRYITDEELNFLFDNVDYILLPYKEIYQSGVLEAVIHFQKPAITSSIPFFSGVKKDYPSFTEVYSPNDGASLARAIMECAESSAPHYTAEDVARYKADHDASRLLAYLREIKNCPEGKERQTL